MSRKARTLAAMGYVLVDPADWSNTLRVIGVSDVRRGDLMNTLEDAGRRALWVNHLTGELVIEQIGSHE